jgi:peptidoglycan/xylan/chitin deacetylase (PgdA/CDA1 family)
MRNAKRLVAAVANHLGVLDTYGFVRRKLVGRHVAIIGYHRVSKEKGVRSFPILSPEGFRSQIEYFCRNYEVLSLDQLVTSLDEGRRLPEKAVVITFDDGYRDNYLCAYPVLKAHGISATIFLASGFVGVDKLPWWDQVIYVVQATSAQCLKIDGLGTYSLESIGNRSAVASEIIANLRRLSETRKNYLMERLMSAAAVELPEGLGRRLMLSWDDVVRMHQDGIDFGAHSVTHPILTNVDVEMAKNEILQSKADIEAHIQSRVKFFAYPNGEVNDQIAGIVKESGFVGAVTADPTWTSPASDSYKLPRILASNDFNIFKAIFCGLWPDIRKAIRYG